MADPAVITQVVTPEVVTPTVVLSERTATFVHYFTWPVATMVVVLVIAAMLLWNAQASSNRIDFKDLILDFDVNRVSLAKFSNLVALCVSSWAMIALVVGGVMTEAYLLAFMGIWSGNALGFQYLKTKSKVDDPMIAG